MTYIVTKTWRDGAGFSTCFRNWRAKDSHCSNLHGYELGVSVSFAAVTLDDANWVIDFAGLKDFKAFLDDALDHKMLVAIDDPHLDDLTMLEQLGVASIRVVTNVSMESVAAYIKEAAENWLFNKELNGRVSIDSVRVYESTKNMVEVR